MRRLIFGALIAFGLINLVSGQDNPGAAVTEAETSQIFQVVAQLRDEIDLIRLEMGKAEAGAPLFRVEKAAPREVYFQAAALFRKADRLAYEHTREQVKEPAPPGREIGPTDVLIMAEAALARVKRVKEGLGIPEPSSPRPLDPAVSHSQLFNSIAAANRELNHLLDHQFAPGDVYRQVSVAIAYAARLLDTPSEVSTPPDPPEKERRKQPADVYRKLGNCFDQIRRIGEKSGVPMLELSVENDRLNQTEPSDVYDMASLLVAELAQLHGMRSDAAPPRSVYDPGRKLPSDVHQRVSILSLQMEALERRVDTNPDWLKD